MEQLEFEKNRFYRIKRGQTAEEAEKTLCRPVSECFAGEIIPAAECEKYAVKPFETYASIAAAHGVDETELSLFNFCRPLYPTRIIFIPKKNS